MNNILIKFKNFPELELEIKDTTLGRAYIRLLKTNYQTSRPIYRDRIKYNVKYMLELAKQAKQAFNWDWDVPEYDLAHTTLLHKDLEQLLGITGFNDVPEEYDHLLMEMHYCLHIIQDPNYLNTRIGAFQIEWFNDTGFNLDDDFEFGTEKNFGDVEFLNPYVGHGPVQIFQENDYTNIPQTCKFHNFVKAGIVISTYRYSINRLKILDYFKTHAPEFVHDQTEEKILHYTGFPKIGQLKNLDVFKRLIECKDIIELESIKFNTDD